MAGKHRGNFAQEQDYWIVWEDLPQFRRDFEASAKELATEQDHIHDDQRRSSAMVEKDKPEHIARPSEDFRQAVDRNSFNEQWLAEERDAAMRQASPEPNYSQDEPYHEQSYDHERHYSR